MDSNDTPSMEFQPLDDETRRRIDLVVETQIRIIAGSYEKANAYTNLIILAGYGSGSKWSLFGGIREAAQVVSYEVPRAIGVLVPVIVAGTLNLNTIGRQQAGVPCGSRDLRDGHLGDEPAPAQHHDPRLLRHRIVRNRSNGLAARCASPGPVATGPAARRRPRARPDPAPPRACAPPRAAPAAVRAPRSGSGRASR